MKWQRVSNDAIGCDGYLIRRYQLGERSHYTAWAPGYELLLSYWGASANEAKDACEADRMTRIHRERRAAQ